MGKSFKKACEIKSKDLEELQTVEGYVGERKVR